MSIRLTMAQALVRYLAAQRTLWQGEQVPLFGGVWAIFGHGNVAGIGEALYRHRDDIPTYRAHNEQAMAHTAIAYAKAHFRRRMMVCTTSIGPGALNLITAAATAHTNRLPVLLLPGDIFVSRAPDPVLQQVEDFGDGTISANDCFKPVSRYFDRIMAPEQLLTALPRAIATLTDPALCGPVTLALPQDVQAAAWDFPDHFFAPRLVRIRAPVPEACEIEAAADALRAARHPLLIAGGGVLYSEGGAAELRRFADTHRVPVAETQAGKSALAWDHPLQAGAIGVTGSSAANALASEADVVIAVGTRLQDFTTGSHSLFPRAKLVSINVNSYDAGKQRSLPVTGDAATALGALSRALSGWTSTSAWHDKALAGAAEWRSTVARILDASVVADMPASGASSVGADAPASGASSVGADAHASGAQSGAVGAPAPGARPLPYDGDVIGAVQRSHPGAVVSSAAQDIVVCAAGTLPGELHKLWRACVPGGYHVEYGFSCMGYEIAGGIGVKMAHPEREVIVMVGDGSYLMMNSEIATSVMLGIKLLIVVQDNRGYGCIHRLQVASGVPGFNNLFDDCVTAADGAPYIDFAAHARSLGADAEHVDSIPALSAALVRARAASKTTVIVIDTDPLRSTEAGGWWWEVGVPEVSEGESVRAARADWAQGKKGQGA